MKKYKFFLILLLILAAQSTLAQKAPEREWVIFNKGVQDYQNQRYDQAEKIFRTVLEKLPNGQLRTAYSLMLAKTFYKQGKYQLSLDSCSAFLKRFPHSKFCDDIRYVQANNYFRLNRIQTAVSTWLYLAEKSGDRRLSAKALDLAGQALRFRLQKSDLINLKRESREDFARRVILYYLAEKYYEEDNHQAALAALTELQSLAGTVLDKKVKRLSALLNHNRQNTLRIAVLLPLSGANAGVGKAVLDGARMAVDDFNRQQGPLVEIVPYDYGTRQINAIRKFKEIAADVSINAVFGPLENDIAVACAGIADYENLPLLTPTATESGLRRLSSKVIQLSIPQDIMARKLARFARDSLHLKRFVTLAPMEDYFIQLTNSFVDHVQENGGQVLSSQWYFPDDRNVTNYFKSIKRTGLRQTFRDSVMRADSLLSVDRADSLYKLYLTEKQNQLLETHSKVDSADIPVKSIDALFAPIYKSDIGLIASQFAYWNIQARLLGNEDWYDLQMLKKNKNYINGLIFISDGYFDPEGRDYKKFRNHFRTVYKRTPEKLEISAFDSFNFILSALANKSLKEINRENFIRFLQEAPPYRGVYRSFNIGRKRFNNEARILQYSYGQILPLQ